MNESSDRETVLITGASAGIGEAIAKEFAEHGHDLVLVARRKTKLARLARSLMKRHDIEVTVLPADLATNTGTETLCAELAEQDIPVDVLINNAGVLTSGSFRNMEPARIDNMLALNIGALTRLSHSLLPAMVERGAGRICNVGSVAAFQPVPSLAVYAATKAYVLSLSEALGEELRGKGVTVTAVCPGFTDTDMFNGPAAERGKEPAVPAIMIMQPEDVARDVYRACMSGDALKVPGIGNAIAIAGTRLMPRWLVRGLSGVMARGGKF